ncbi:hypothetical protein G7078_05830 [Sphingomonas sinipercae]|uniref:Lipoprotein n=1 Tax=Sphingomonas sinipercae TaxID=2714944 RepID=A0A6G7ZMY7_9SPHN|nr:hypothetical protein [Sphingomonas sinipercae]QIL02357.1 hypothetical protein G7078_05830 [Sphingomonas sinipercae]
MDRRALGFAIALALTASACSREQPVVIDGSSQHQFERTTELARRELSNADRLVFDRAIHSIGGRRMAQRDAGALARTTFDGMTARQVVDDQRSRDP